MLQYDFSTAVLSKCNTLRKKYFDSPWKQKSHLIWWVFKRLFYRMPMYKPVSSSKIHILFNLDGGIGDIVLALNFLKQFKSRIYSNNVIDICVPLYLLDTVQRLCFQHSFVAHVHTLQSVGCQYDMVVHFIRVPVLIYVCHKKVEQDSFLAKWVDTIQSFNRFEGACMTAGSVGDALCEVYTKITGRNRLSQGDIGSLIHITDEFVVYPQEKTLKILKKYGLSEGAFITVQRGTGSADGLNDHSTRLWDLDKYYLLCHDLKKIWPDTVIVQLGDKMCEKIKSADINLCGKTTFDELLVLLKTAKYHIDGECGMVHLRHFLSGKPSVVLFGPTKKDFYAYTENINITSDACIGCEWVHENWRNWCLKSGNKPVCLQKISPQFVIQKIREYEYAKNKTVPISAG